MAAHFVPARQYAFILLFVFLLPFAAPACGKSVADRVDDATITVNVKTALLNDAHVSGSTIDVVTTQGIVTMVGSVGSKAQEMRAVEIARHTPGVRDVRSQLQVSSTPQA